LESTKKAGRFAADFATEQICDLNPKRIQAWLDGLIREDGVAFSAGSKQGYRLALSGFFSFCVRQEWVSVHPIKERIHSYGSDEDTQPGIFVASEASKLLEAADAEVLPVIAIGLFAGLRPTEIWRLSWNDIIWHKAQIDVHGSTSKTARYRFVSMSANLLEWLAPYRSATGRIWKGSQPNLNKRITATAKAAGIPSWPKDGLRHSFGSHYLALHNNAPLTAKEMGHRDTQMLFKHYNNRRNQDEAAAYFAIRPIVCQELLAA
jgi:integrase